MVSGIFGFSENFFCADSKTSYMAQRLNKRVRQILLETFLEFSHISPIVSKSSVDPSIKPIKSLDNGIVVYPATYYRLLITIPETHPLFGFLPLLWNNGRWVSNLFPIRHMDAVKNMVREMLISLTK